MKTNEKPSQEHGNLENNEVLMPDFERLTPQYVQGLSDKQRDELTIQLAARLKELNGEERDTYCNKFSFIFTDDVSNQIWERNHIQITMAMSALMQELGCMPTKTQIAGKTGLSRPTVDKHLKEYYQHPRHQEQLEQFRFLKPKVLTTVYRAAENGNIAAAKLYFNMVADSNKEPNSTRIQHQNNYIQINGTVLKQETIRHLKPEQLKAIENIVKKALPGTEMQDAAIKERKP